MHDRRCPDCGVTMEPTSLRSNGGHGPVVETGTRDGILGTIGLGETTGVDTIWCPECGLVRLDADLE